MDALVELAKVIIPASVVLYLAYLLVRSFIQKEVDTRKLEIRGRSIETVLPNRLHAYERMALFLERMAPQNLLIRVSPGTISAREFQQLILAEIRNEYNHNAAQQIYISEDVWELIKTAKENLIMNVNEAANDVGPEASSLDLSRKIFEKTIETNVDPIGHALTALKREIQSTF